MDIKGLTGSLSLGFCSNINQASKRTAILSSLQLSVTLFTIPSFLLLTPGLLSTPSKSTSKMKYTTALTVLLAFGPVTTILAAPLTQDPASALTAGPAPGGQDEGAKQPAGPTPGGSSSQGMSGSSMGNEGLLDKVEKLIKDVLGGVSCPFFDAG